MDAKATPQNIQDAFLNTARRERSTVTIYLMHGAKLTGRIRSFDKFSVLLETGSQEQLIFKHAISTISHARRSSGDLRPATQAASPPPAEAAPTEPAETPEP
ncbi:MAG TPA: RNA chaperone Hfq [Pyrinomonadaceae bacterium]|nr:RNA chaperone Hfq [Pyrinomonadaceae bacterium]